MEIHPDQDEITASTEKGPRGPFRSWRLVLAIAIPIIYVVYLTGISENPPGYYVDESGLSYNAYLVSQTGAGEFGGKFPLYFQLYTGGFAQYSNPTQIYILAAVYNVFGPGILISRVTAATCVFVACVLLGFLAGKISKSRVVGLLVGLNALTLPWLFEVGRLVLETFFYPLAVVLFLCSCYIAHRKASWRWINIVAILACLDLLTYSYTIGRLFGPLMALGLVLLKANRKTLVSVAITWTLYGISLIPLAVYYLNNPELADRFRMLSYIKAETSFTEAVTTFIVRYLQDIGPVTVLFYGDSNPRHHIPDALGSVYFATFVLAVIGLFIVLAKRLDDRWWRFLLFGFAVCVVPGALTVDPFHTLRTIAFPVFLLLFTVPTFEWLIEGFSGGEAANGDSDNVSVNNLRQMLVGVLALTFIVEAGYFHYKYYEYGPKRGYVFDAAYKSVYDPAVAQPDRPIYLEDGYWGPMYIHSLWYATLEGREAAEFVHLRYGERPPPGAVVISSEKQCSDCLIVNKEEIFMLYINEPQR